MTPLEWAVLAIAAVTVGFAKTAIGGAGALAVALFAIVLPARESTGVLLVVLLAGDLIAVTTYRRNAHWATILVLVPPVLLGLAVGGVFLALADGTTMRRTIGWVLLLLTGWQVLLLLRRRAAARNRADREGSSARAAPPAPGRAAGRVFGSLAGFTTMVANAGGAPMSLYLLRVRLSVVDFVGTMAWFFFAVNLLKLPVSIGLGLVRPARLALCLSLIPAVVLGAVIGRTVIRRLDEDAFERWVLALVAVSAGYLVLG